MAKVVKRSHGRLLLVAVAQVTEAREIAARCNVVKSCVSKWLSGEAEPSERPRRVLEQIYGIEADAWSTPPRHAARARSLVSPG